MYPDDGRQPGQQEICVDMSVFLMYSACVWANRRDVLAQQCRGSYGQQHTTLKTRQMSWSFMTVFILVYYRRYHQCFSTLHRLICVFLVDTRPAQHCCCSCCTNLCQVHAAVTEGCALFLGFTPSTCLKCNNCTYMIVYNP